MRQDIHVHLDLSVPTRTVVLFLTAALLVTVTPELGSENVTLSTYYPAPSGVYSRMITTQDTFLATTGGEVGIGTTSPGAKLSFANLNDGRNTPDGITWYNPAPTSYGIYRSGGSWSGPDYQQLTLAWDTGIVLSPGVSYGKSYVDVTGGGLRVTQGSVRVAAGNISIGGPAGSHAGYLYIDAEGQSGCSSQRLYDFGASGGGNICPVGSCSGGGACYATFNQGIYINGWSYSGHGGSVTVTRHGGTADATRTNQVLAHTPGTSINLGSVLTETAWGALNPPSTGFYVYCCPK